MFELCLDYENANPQNEENELTEFFLYPPSQRVQVKIAITWRALSCDLTDFVLSGAIFAFLFMLL